MGTSPASSDILSVRGEIGGIAVLIAADATYLTEDGDYYLAEDSSYLMLE